MRFVREYHSKAKPTSPKRDGFVYPFKLVQAGWLEWKKSGRIPHPDELAKLPVEWVNDIHTLHALVEAGKPDNT